MISVQDPRLLVESLITFGRSADGAVERDLRAALSQQHDEIAELRAEVDRLRHRNAALVEIVAESRCPYDGRAAVAECQQCGCSHGLLIKPLASEQTASKGG